MGKDDGRKCEGDPAGPTRAGRKRRGGGQEIVLGENAACKKKKGKVKENRDLRLIWGASRKVCTMVTYITISKGSARPGTVETWGFVDEARLKKKIGGGRAETKTTITGPAKP